MSDLVDRIAKVIHDEMMPGDDGAPIEEDYRLAEKVADIFDLYEHVGRGDRYWATPYQILNDDDEWEWDD